MNNLFEYKRKSHIKIGEVYFWTATINKWQYLLQEDEFKNIVISSFEYLSNSGKMDVFTFVIMPNHIHAIVRINELNGKETTQGVFLKYTAHEFKKLLLSKYLHRLALYEVVAKNKQYEFWERDSLAIHLYTQEVAFQKLDYIHNNPLASHWNLSTRPECYKYSSAQYYELGDKSYIFLKDLREVF